MTQPDDLPRSPSGRVPQWVHDEAAGRPGPGTAWRAPARHTAPPPGPRRPRRGLRGRSVATVVLVLGLLGGVGWWSTTGLGPPDGGLTGAAPGGPGAPVDGPPGGAGPAGRTGQADDASPARSEPPSADVVALADEAFLTEEGRALFFAARPALLGAAEFAGRCDRGDTALVTTGVVGCFHQGTNAIVLYVPADPRLRGFLVETAAHELLHAAWETLGADERTELTAVLEAELARVPADDPLHEQLAGSIGSRPENRPTELFAYVGTQVWRDGGLAGPLEQTYARFVTDRAALVAVHHQWRAVLDDARAEIETAQVALVERRNAHAQQQATQTGESAAVDSYREAYEAKVAEVRAMPAEEQARVRLSWVWWDGTELAMAPAEETLARAAELLARDDAVLEARARELAVEEAAIDAERARLDALVADFEMLNAQLSPS